MFNSFIKNWLLNYNSYTIINRQFPNGKVANGSYNPCKGVHKIVKSNKINKIIYNTGCIRKK